LQLDRWLKDWSPSGAIALLDRAFQWAAGLGVAFWVSVAVVACVFGWRALARWRIRRSNRRREAEYERAAERRWRGHRRDPWTERLGYRQKWSRRYTSRQWISIAAAVLALGLAAIWFVRDSWDLLLGYSQPAQSYLRVKTNTASNSELVRMSGIRTAFVEFNILERPRHCGNGPERAG